MIFVDKLFDFDKNIDLNKSFDCLTNLDFLQNCDKKYRFLTKFLIFQNLDAVLPRRSNGSKNRRNE